MKRKIFILLLIIGVWGCENSNDSGNENPGSEEFRILTNSQITTETAPSGFEEMPEITLARIIEGEQLVFVYTFIHPDAVFISDDELTEQLIFEIDPNLSSFTLSGDELLEHSTFYTQFCFCVSSGDIAISNGTITGTRINEDRWQVNFDISLNLFNEQHSLSGNGVFAVE